MFCASILYVIGNRFLWNFFMAGIYFQSSCQKFAKILKFKILVLPTLYIPNWSLQPFSHNYDLASHSTYVVCVSFYLKDGTYSLQSAQKNRLVRSFSRQFYLLSDFSPEICWEEVVEEIFLYFRFDVWPREHGPYL